MSKQLYYKLYFILLFVESFSAILYLLYWMFGLDLKYLFKLPMLAYFFLLVVFHFRYKLYLNTISYLFIIYFVIEFIRGLIINTAFSGPFYTHIYTAVTPVLAISFGKHFALDYTEKLSRSVMKILNLTAITTAFFVLAYILSFYFFNMIEYFGFGALSYLVVAYLLSIKKYRLYVIMMLIVVFSGKRSTLINSLVISFLHFVQGIDIKKILYIVVFTILTVSIFPLLEKQDIFRRIEQTLSFDMDDEDASYKATSGRWQEIVSVSNNFNEKPLNWIFGGGYGITYTYQDNLYGRDNTEVKHYTHFSPFAYILVYGIPFALILYFVFFRTAFLARKLNGNFFYLAYIGLITIGFFGSNLFIDSKPWFYMSILLLYPTNRNLYIFNYNK